MIFSIVVYILILALIIWGGRFAGINKYHEDFLSMDSMKSLRGLAAFLILIHHISQEQPLMMTGELQFFYNVGPFLVSIFFFSSGYGLVKNIKTKQNYFDHFLQKRLLFAIVLPFFVNEVLYELYHLISGMPMIPSQFICTLLGMNLANGYAWFPIVLAILYLGFYLIFKNVKNHKLGYAFIFLLIIGQGLFFALRGHFAWWAGDPNWWLAPGALEHAAWWKKEFTFWFFGQWWVNSTIGFLVGMLVSEYEEKLIPWLKKKYWIKLIAVLILAFAFHRLSELAQGRIGYYTENLGMGPGIGDKFITYLSQIPEITFFLLAICIGMMKFKSSNPVTAFFGKYSLHTYLMNLMAIELGRFIIYKNGRADIKPWNWNQAVYAVFVVVFSILLALLENTIVTLLQKKLTKK